MSPEELERLLALGYLSAYVEATDDEGITIHQRDRVFASMNLFTSGHAPAAYLMDMDGEILDSWRYSFEDLWDEERPEGNSGDFGGRGPCFAHGHVSASSGGRGVLERFDTGYVAFTAKHFWGRLGAEHGVSRSYNWVRLTLQAHGRVRPAPRRGAHRRKRPRRPMAGMMLHQDGSSHEWVAGQRWDLIVTLDDATSEVASGFFVAEEGTMSTFRALGEVIAAKGLFCSLYADRGSHYWHTPEAGGGVDKDNPTQVGRALNQLGIKLIPAYSPEARGRFRAHVRHAPEAPAPGAAPGRDRHHGRG